VPRPSLCKHVKAQTEISTIQFTPLGDPQRMRPPGGKSSSCESFAGGAAPYASMWRFRGFNYWFNLIGVYWIHFGGLLWATMVRASLPYSTYYSTSLAYRQVRGGCQPVAKIQTYARSSCHTDRCRNRCCSHANRKT